MFRAVSATEWNSVRARESLNLIAGQLEHEFPILIRAGPVAIADAGYMGGAMRARGFGFSLGVLMVVVGLVLSACHALISRIFWLARARGAARSLCNWLSARAVCS